MKNIIRKACEIALRPITNANMRTNALIERQLILNAQILLNNRKGTKYSKIRDAEFRVFSQWGEDGIIQYILAHTEILNKTFIEFGVEDYNESNTRFLLLKDDWKGLIIDGSEEHIRKIKTREWAWRHSLKPRHAFIDRSNVNQLFIEAGITDDIGLLSIDIDGNDYWIWESITAVSPRIVITEYNGLWGDKDAVSTPYDPSFIRSKKHYSNLYFGASLRAMMQLGHRKGYKFVGTNSHGLNAFFIRNDVATQIMDTTIEAEFEKHRFMQGRTPQGKLSFLDYEEERRLLSQMPLFDIEKNQAVKVSELERAQ